MLSEKSHWPFQNGIPFSSVPCRPAMPLVRSRNPAPEALDEACTPKVPNSGRIEADYMVRLQRKSCFAVNHREGGRGQDPPILNHPSWEKPPRRSFDLPFSPVLNYSTLENSFGKVPRRNAARPAADSLRITLPLD